jgi:5-epi-alpha-selinene synthase
MKPEDERVGGGLLTIDRDRFFYPMPPRKSPHAAGLGEQTLAWAQRFQLAPDPKALKKIVAIQLEEMTAAIYAEAEPELLQLCNDMLLWFFVSDDQYDERAIGTSPLKMEKVCSNFLRILQTGNERAAISPLGRALLDLRRRIVDRASPAWYARFLASMELYFQGCLQEAHNRASERVPEFDEYRGLRRASVGTYPCFDLIELSLREELPREVLSHPALAVLRDLSTDVIAWVNDIVSFQKERAFLDPHNIIVVLNHECGISINEALAKTIEIHNEAMEEFQRIARRFLAEAPAQAQRYIAGLELWMRGVFDWSFLSARYKSDYLSLSLEAKHILLHVD